MKRILIALCCLAGLTWAQVDTGTIAGSVRDASGALIPQAAVRITETQTNNRFEVLTDKQGDYVSPPLRVGTYTVSVVLPGFKMYTREGIVLNVKDRLRVDAQMEIGANTEQVLVSAEVAPVQADTSSLGQVISAQQVVDMPLNGRNYVNLAALTTGVTNTSTGTNGNTAGAFSSTVREETSTTISSMESTTITTVAGAHNSALMWMPLPNSRSRPTLMTRSSDAAAGQP
jgi:hypothetical protein